VTACESDSGDTIPETVKFQQLRKILEKQGDLDQIIIKSRPKKHLIQTERGSKYRGVSKNGKKWQVSWLGAPPYLLASLRFEITKFCWVL
jgi:hypothetical protein